MKKFFAVALATTMALSTVMTATAATDDYECAAFASANSGTETLTGNFDITYSYHVNAYQLGVNGYENVLFELFTDGVDGVAHGASNYLSVVCNGNAWWWDGDDAASKWAGGVITNTCTDTDMTILKDADVVLNVKRTGNTVTGSAKVGNTEVWAFSATAGSDIPNTVGIHLSGEQVKVSNLKFTNNTGAAGDTEQTTTPDNTATPDNSTTNSGTDDTDASGNDGSQDDGNTTTAGTTTAGTTTAGATTSSTTTTTTTTTNPSSDTGNLETEVNVEKTIVADTEAASVEKEATVENLEAAGLAADTKVAVNAIAETEPVYAVISDFLTKTLKSDKAAAVDLSLETVDGKKVETQPNGKVKVTLPLFDNIKDAKWVAVYRYNDTSKAFDLLDTVEVKDGKFAFETDHFTPYIFASVDAPKTNTDNNKTDNNNTTTTTSTTKTDTTTGPKTGDAAPVVAFIAMAGVAGAVVVTRRKRA